MRLSVPFCPVCGAVAQGAVTDIPGLAEFSHDGDNVVWSGDTDLWWEDQKPRTGATGKCIITCGTHQWESDIDGYEGD